VAINKTASVVARGKTKGEQASVGEVAEAENQPVNVTRIALLMQDMGYRGKLVHGDDWCWVESATNGNKFSIYAYSADLADPNSQARSIQFDGGWGGLSSYDARRFLMVCNRFNHAWRYAKATVVSDNDRYSLSVKLDHYCPNGLTDEAFFAVADMYVQLIEDMTKRTVAVEGDALNVLVERHNEAVGIMWGAESDPEQALDIYLANARSGYGGSMNSLGDLYEHGAEVGQSALAAAYFFARAAERGQPSAYYGLARILSEGVVDEAISVEAAKYALLASRDLPEGQSKCRAEMLRDELMRKLGSEDQKTAINLAENWMPLIFEGGPLENGPIHDNVHSPPSSVLN
jgi:hypothetical protein